MSLCLVSGALAESSAPAGKSEQRTDAAATDRAIGADTEQMPAAPAMRNFPYPVNQYSLTVSGGKATLSLGLDTVADIALLVGDANQKNAEPQKLSFQQVKGIQDVAFSVSSEASIDLRISSGSFDFATVISVKNGQIGNPLALYSNYAYKDKSALSLSAANSESEPNDAYNSSGVKNTASDDTNTGTLTTSDAVDYWKFTLAHKSWINLFLSVPSGNDYDIYVYKSDNLSTAVLSGTNGVSSNELLTMQALDAGTYYVKIYGYSRIGTGSYSMRWRISRQWPVNWNTAMSRGYDPSVPHYGLDILPSSKTAQESSSNCHNNVCYKGDAIVAMQDGTVSFAGSLSSFGIAVYINHGVQSDGTYIQSRYGHLYSKLVNSGDPVTAGQIIGYMGNRGTAILSDYDGTHLHFEILQDTSAIDNSTPADHHQHKNPLLWYPGY